MTGFDAQGQPFVCCVDCGVPEPVAWKRMEHRAFLWLRRHNSKYHPGRRIPRVLPRRDLGLVDW